MKYRLSLITAALVAAVTLPVALRASSPKPDKPVGAVYTASNEVGGNRILIFDRLPGGQLSPAGSVATDGYGTGAGLGNQGGLILSRNEKWLLAVNAGSDSVSVFEVKHNGLKLRSVQWSGGARPVSLTMHKDLVFVLNAGSDQITGFEMRQKGELEPLPGSTRDLSTTGTAPAQIAFTPDGGTLVVTEKATNRILTFPVDKRGMPQAPFVYQSVGDTPFGFAFGRRDQMFVSEAFGGGTDLSAVSSYMVTDTSELATIDPSVATTETAACWVGVTPNGRFVYTTNTGSSTLTGFAVDFDGTLTLLDADGATAMTGVGSRPIDLGFADGGRYLYELNGGTNTIGAFRVDPDSGALTGLGFTGGLPASANGLAVR